MFDIVLFYAILAAVFTFGKAIVTLAQPFFACAIRLIPAGIILLGITHFFEKKSLKIQKRYQPLKTFQPNNL